jgi:Amt family ammonium transporter
MMPVTTGNGLLFGGGGKLLFAQFVGVVSVGAFTLGVGLIAWGIIKVIIGVRVSPEEEHDGLDIGEHGMEAYPDFQAVAERSESVVVST